MLRRIHPVIYQTLILISVMAGCDPEKEPAFEAPVDLCPDDPNKTAPGACGCGVADVLNAITGFYTCVSEDVDFCPNDESKTLPGVCGCGVADVKGTDGKYLCQAVDLCPDDPNKTVPGICGCGVSDNISTKTGLPACLDEQLDLCPDNPNKTAPGICGCQVDDTLDETTGIPLCILDAIDLCPDDPDKTLPGECGCGTPDVDTDKDGVLDCKDECPEDPNKVEAGTCGCGTPDSMQSLADSDQDGVPNCLDACPQNRFKSEADGCECNALIYAVDKEKISLCARMITNAGDLIALRDDWNSGVYSNAKESLAFVLVDDINLGDRLTAEMASQWMGIGTEEYPFNGIFNGNQHSISATRKSGYTEQQLTLGDMDLPDMGLFGYLMDARVESLNLKIIIEGSDNVSALAAHAENTTIRDIQIETQVKADNYGAGAVAVLKNSTMSNVTVKGNVAVAKSWAGGAIAQGNAVQMSDIDASCTVIGENNTGGMAGGIAGSSRLIDIYASGPVTGAGYTGGIMGMMMHSSMLNAYTTATVYCKTEPCSAFVAHIEDFSMIKNAYTTGRVVNYQSPQAKTPSENTGKPGTTPSNGAPDEPSIPNGPLVFPVPTQLSYIPQAMLFASIGSADNVTSALYYWNETQTEPLPEVSDMTGIGKPTGFSYSKLRPYTADKSLYLLNVLNDVLNCKNGACTIENFDCLQWTAGIFALPMLDASDSVMSVTVPRLRIGH